MTQWTKDGQPFTQDDVPEDIILGAVSPRGSDWTQTTDIVYWIHTPEHSDPRTQGYIGITSDIKSRINAHLKRPNVIVGAAMRKYDEEAIVFSVLFEGDRDTCLAIEHHLRPSRGLGWNIDVGGRRTWTPKSTQSRKTGWTHSDETKALLSERARGVPKSAAHRQSMADAKKNMSSEKRKLWIDKIRKARTGSVASDATRQKRSETMSRLRWWNNGIVSVRSVESPGDEWNAGRIKWKK